MLIEFRVENHRSIRDEQVLSMEAAVDKGEKEDLRPRTVKGYKKKLLPVACIYGANASGKSNVLSALAWMRDAVENSSRFWDVITTIPREPFAWSATKTLPSMYEVTFLIGGVQYQYGFAVSDSAVIEEWLYAWPNGKKQAWFERDGQNFKVSNTNLKGDFKPVEISTRSNALFLSTARQLNGLELQPIWWWFVKLDIIPSNMGFPPSSSTSIEMEFAALVSVKDQSLSKTGLDSFRAFLKMADLGVRDCKIVTENDPRTKRPYSRILLQHQHLEETETWLPLEQESRGTQTLFEVGLPVLRALNTGSVLVIDELESSLHPALARYIVDLFNNPKTNPKNAQLIFTTHDTNLLGNTLGDPELRRDEVWLTEKDKDGATVVYPLTEFKPRKDENMERGYLQGRYGAIPFLGNFSLGGE